MVYSCQSLVGIVDNEPRLSRKYRDFMISGGMRVIATRFFSLLYTYIVARLIVKDEMDILVILASTQMILVLFSTYGLRFSAVHFGLGKHRVEGGTALPFQVTLYVGLPSMLLLTEVVVILMELAFGQASVFHPLMADSGLHLAFLFSNAMAILLEGITKVQVALLNVDKEAGLRALYSVTNSIFVPLAYYIQPGVTSVVWTWGILMALTTAVGIWILPDRKSLVRIRAHEIWKIIRFGFAYNLTSVLVVFSGYYDQFIIALNFDPGVLTDYYWPQRIALIGTEVFAVVMTGLFPLLTKLEAEHGKEVAIKRFRVMYKLIAYGASIFFTGLLVTSDLAVHLLLGDNYAASVEYLQLFAVMAWFQSINQLLRIRLNAYGSRRLVVYTDLLAAFTRMLLLTLASFLSIEALIMARILTFMVISTYILSFRNFVGIGWKYTGWYLLIGTIHFMIGYGLTLWIANVWIRIGIGLLVTFFSVGMALKFKFIGREERLLIRRIIDRRV